MEFLIEYGYVGVFIASFLAATVLPFSSEVVLTGVLLAGAAYWPCMIAATLGNFLGGMSCYWLGMLGKVEWIEKYLRIKKSSLDKTQKFLQGKGALMAFFVFLPAGGDLNGLFRFPSRYRRFYRRGARFSPRQYLDRGCLDVSRKGDPILGLDGICL